MIRPRPFRDTVRVRSTSPLRGFAGALVMTRKDSSDRVLYRMYVVERSRLPEALARGGWLEEGSSNE